MTLMPSREETEMWERKSFNCMVGKSWDDLEKEFRKNGGQSFVITYKQIDPSVRSWIAESYVLGRVGGGGYVFQDSDLLDYGHHNFPSAIKNLNQHFSVLDWPGGEKKIVEISFDRQLFDGHVMMAFGQLNHVRTRNGNDLFEKRNQLDVRKALISADELDLHRILRTFVKSVESPGFSKELEEYQAYVGSMLKQWEEEQESLIDRLAASNAMVERYKRIAGIFSS